MYASEPRRRSLIAGAAALLATSVKAQAVNPPVEASHPAAAPAEAAPAAANAPAAASPPSPSTSSSTNPHVTVQTGQGLFVLELFADKAPITAANFLHYVRARRFDGSSFYRAVRREGALDTGFIQGGLQNATGKLFPPIKHESTTSTGIQHLDGTISMARVKPGSATADFFICLGAAPYLDADPAGPGDNLGFAAFGRVVQGMEVIHAILALPTPGFAKNPVMKGQILDPPVPITAMRLKT